MPSTQPTFPFTVQARTGSIIILSASFSHVCDNGRVYRVLMLHALHLGDPTLEPQERHLPITSMIDALSDSHARVSLATTGMNAADIARIIESAEYRTQLQTAVCEKLLAATAHEPRPTANATLPEAPR